MKVINEVMEKPTFCAIFPQDKCKILFFDIETTGLSPKASSLYMIGAMFYDAPSCVYKLIQWFADDYRSEENIILNFLDFLEKYSYLYHFNGKTFDIPYILNKCEKYNISPTPHCEKILHDKDGVYSIDILSGIRTMKKKLNIDKANQTALELWLGIHREDKYNGGELISVYSKYMQYLRIKPEKAPELEHLLLLHNKDDIGGMLEVASILNYKSLFTDFIPDNKCLKNIELTENGEISVTFSHGFILPRPVSFDIKYPKSILADGMAEIFKTSLYLSEMEGCLKIQVFQGILYHFYDNFKDYYYIPENDIAIHKSSISGCDKSKLKKATRNTCYRKQDGFFIPSSSGQDADCPRKIFKYDAKDRLFFYQLSPDDFDLSIQETCLLWCKIITDALRL